MNARRICQGYQGSIFGDQTQAVVLRVKRIKNQQIRDATSTNSEDDDSSSDFSITDLPTQGNVPLSITFPLEVYSINSFMTNFVLPSRPSHFSAGHLKYLPRLYKNSAAEAPLSYATAALCCAAAGTFSNGPRVQIIDLAKKNYVTALAKVNEALQDPKTRVANETITAIMLFGVIESLLASPSLSWNTSKHLDGLVTLLDMRGEDMAKDEVSAALYTTTRTMAVSTGKLRLIMCFSLSLIYHSFWIVVRE